MSAKFTADRENLLVTSPSSNNRYSKRTTVDVHDTILPAACHLLTNYPVPAYHDHNWQQYVHPEGKPYSSRKGSLTVITEADVSNPTTACHLDAWITLIINIAKEDGLEFHTGVELFLDPEDDGDSCCYYFVDHETRAVFWLDANETQVLGLPASVSEQHLKQAIEQNYWIHIEMFCMHLKALPRGALEELISIFMHGQIDNMTSMTSTFPYTKEECADFLKILSACRSLSSQPNTYPCVARLWVHVTSNRFITHYGEAHCRLDRTTSITGGRTVTKSRLLNAISRALFCLPQGLAEKLEDQFVDDLVMKNKWSEFIRGQIADWKLSMQWTFAILVGHALTLPTAYSSALAHTSLLICATGILVGTILSIRHEDLVEADATEAATFLNDQLTPSGFQRLATLYTIPRAFFIWALILFVVQAACIVLSPLPQPFGALSGIVLGSVAVALFRALNPTVCFNTPAFPRIPIPFFSERRKEEVLV